MWYFWGSQTAFDWQEKVAAVEANQWVSRVVSGHSSGFLLTVGYSTGETHEQRWKRWSGMVSQWSTGSLWWGFSGGGWLPGYWGVASLHWHRGGPRPLCCRSSFRPQCCLCWISLWCYITQNVAQKVTREPKMFFFSLMRQCNILLYGIIFWHVRLGHQGAVLYTHADKQK